MTKRGEYISKNTYTAIMYMYLGMQIFITIHQLDSPTQDRFAVYLIIQESKTNTYL